MDLNGLGVLGVDIDGVVMELNDYQEEGLTLGMRAPGEIVGARTALRRLRDERFGEALFLVSKCGPATEATMRHTLQQSSFCDETGISIDRVIFCRQRIEKAAISQELGITHFVDDRLEVLSYLQSVSHRHLFSPDPEEVRRFEAALSLVEVVDDWASLTQVLLGS